MRGRWQEAEGGRHPADPSTTPRGTTRGSAHTCPGGQCQGDAGSPPRSEMAESRERFCSLAPRGRCLGNEAESSEGQSSGERGQKVEGRGWFCSIAHMPRASPGPEFRAEWAEAPVVFGLLLFQSAEPMPSWFNDHKCSL